jgi:hypothetical protein
MNIVIFMLIFYVLIKLLWQLFVIGRFWRNSRVKFFTGPFLTEGS